VILTGGTQVALMVQTPDGPVERKPTVTVQGTGSTGEAPKSPITNVTAERVGTTTRIATGDYVVVVRHVLDEDWTDEGSRTLMGTWATMTEPTTLAFLA
jgi:hypothetical protein